MSGVRLTWELDRPMPLDVERRVTLAAG